MPVGQTQPEVFQSGSAGLVGPPGKLEGSFLFSACPRSSPVKFVSLLSFLTELGPRNPQLREIEKRCPVGFYFELY